MAVCPTSPTTTRPKEAKLNGLKIPQFAASETLTTKVSVVCSSTLRVGCNDIDAPDFVDIVAA